MLLLCDPTAQKHHPARNNSAQNQSVRRNPAARQWAARIPLAAFALALLSGAALRADTITSVPVTVAATDAGGHDSLPTSTTFSLPEFNTALGTLTGVEVDLN